MQIIDTTEMEDGALQITIQADADMVLPLAALGIKYAIASAAILETGNAVDGTENDPDLETVNRTLSAQVQKLMAELTEADAVIHRLRSELAEAQRSADLERGRG